MENGAEAPIDGRTVALSSKSLGPVGTGFLYSDRIVLTCGHCLFMGESSVRMNDFQIDLPNAVYRSRSPKVDVIKTFLAPDWAPRDEINFTSRGDFAILILDKPISISGKTLIASKLEVDKHLNARSSIINIAYGRQSVDHEVRSGTEPKYAEYSLVPESEVLAFVDEVERSFGRDLLYHMTINVIQKPGGPSTCSGDSGSPLYMKQENNFIYFGPLAYGIGGMPNCSGKPWTSEMMYVGSVAAYNYLDLIKQAEDHVAANPYVAPAAEKTIKCVKGKKSKKIVGANPKCPKGYKQK